MLTTIMIRRSSRAYVWMSNVWTSERFGMLRDPIPTTDPVPAAGRLICRWTHSMLNHLTLKSNIYWNKKNSNVKPMQMQHSHNYLNCFFSDSLFSLRHSRQVYPILRIHLNRLKLLSLTVRTMRAHKKNSLVYNFYISSKLLFVILVVLCIFIPSIMTTIGWQHDFLLIPLLFL